MSPLPRTNPHLHEKNLLLYLNHRRSQYEANRGTRLGKILPNTVDFYFFYQTDNIRRFHTADFVQRTVCSPRLQFLPGYGPDFLPRKGRYLLCNGCGDDTHLLKKPVPTHH